MNRFDAELMAMLGPDGNFRFRLDLGRPRFGAVAVGARGSGIKLAGNGSSCVAHLAESNPSWCSSIFVPIGNPHCVTLARHPDALPSTEAMHTPTMHARFAKIAFAQVYPGDNRSNGSGDLFPNGINLQWAAPGSETQILARVFERGEGATASSGTSAAAVACAFWRSGLASAGRVDVEMPGGTVPLDLIEHHGHLSDVRLLGVASRRMPLPC